MADSWRLIDPDFALEPFKVSNLPTIGGLDASIAVDYDLDLTTDDLIVGLARSYDGVVYVLLLKGPLNAFQQRNAQVGLVDTGFTITAIEQVDLSGVELQPVTAEMLAELEAFIQAQLENFGIPGAAVVVVQDDEIVYAEGFGVRTLDSDEPVTAETLMPLGPTIRSMTTLMLANAIDEGLVEWDTPVQAVLPDFRVADAELSQQLTMYHLVCACSGVPSRNWEVFFNWDGLTAEDVVEGLQAFEFFTSFGETYQYSHHLMATGCYATKAMPSRLSGRPAGSDPGGSNMTVLPG